MTTQRMVSILSMHGVDCAVSGESVLVSELSCFKGEASIEIIEMKPEEYTTKDLLLYLGY